MAHASLRIFCCIILVGMFSFLTGCGNPSSPAPNEVCFERTCFTVEFALTAEQHMRGLMWRESLSDGHGMLFVFPRSDNYLFWMKNTLIPLDMLWLDDTATVIYIEEQVQPCVLDPCPKYGPR